MNTIDVMKQTLAYLENGHFTYETKIADDLRAAIQQEEQAKTADFTKHINAKAWPFQPWMGRLYEE
jgi:hypothetical protein